MRDVLDQPLHGVAIYNPDLLSKQELIAQFVARRALLKRLVDELKGPGSPQHVLLVGQRGMGKTTLLRRLGYAVEDDADLGRMWLPLGFPEEQYNIMCLSDFWANCLDALGDYLEERGRHGEAEALDQAVAALPDQDDVRAREILDLLMRWAERLDKRFVLLVDNLDLILDRVKEEHWALREVLSHEDRLLLIGTSAAAIEATYQYDAAFYDFFQIHELRSLDIEEIEEVLLRLAEVNDAPQVARVVHNDPARIRTIQVLSGGNPRTMVLLYGVLAQESEGAVRTDLEHLLDQCTPLYKARFEALPSQAQHIVHALALHWDPISAGDLAQLVRLETNIVSAQLNRLVKQGVVEKVPYHPKSKTGFQVAERFFNIWYLMRASRRVRRKLIWLVEFLKLFYGPAQLSGRARQYLRDHKLWHGTGAVQQVEYGLALAQAVSEEPLRAALENTALREVAGDPALRRRIRDLFDLEDIDSDLAPHLELHRALAEIHDIIRSLDVGLPEWDPARFAMLFVGAPHITLAQKRGIASRFKDISSSAFYKLREFLESCYERDEILLGEPRAAEHLYTAVQEGYMLDWKDLAGARVAAESLDAPELPAVVLANRLLADRSKQACAELEEYLPSTSVPYVWFVHGMLTWTNLRDVDGALISLGHALRIKNDYRWGRYARGFLLQEAGRLDEAEAEYRKIIECDPASAPAWIGLGALLASSPGRLADARAAYHRALDLAGSPLISVGSLAWLIDDSAGKMFDVAEEVARNAVAWDPGRSWLVLAMVLASRGSWAEARQMAMRAMELEAEEPAGFLETYWNEILEFFREAVRAGQAQDAGLLLDELGLGERWRPLREALAVIAEGSPARLRNVAPEIRDPAEQLVAQLSA